MNKELKLLLETVTDELYKQGMSAAKDQEGLKDHKAASNLYGQTALLCGHLAGALENTIKRLYPDEPNLFS